MRTPLSHEVHRVIALCWVIEEVSAISTSISSAIEQQGAAPAEIARNVQQTAQTAQDVTTNISGVRASANEAGLVAGEVLRSAADVSQQLTAEVATFVARVRAESSHEC